MTGAGQRRWTWQEQAGFLRNLLRAIDKDGRPGSRTHCPISNLAVRVPGQGIVISGRWDWHSSCCEARGCLLHDQSMKMIA